MAPIANIVIVVMLTLESVNLRATHTMIQNRLRMLSMDLDIPVWPGGLQ